MSFSYNCLPSGASGSPASDAVEPITMVAGGMIAMQWETSLGAVGSTSPPVPTLNLNGNLPFVPTVVGLGTINNGVDFFASWTIQFQGEATPPGIYLLTLSILQSEVASDCMAFQVTFAAAPGAGAPPGVPVIANSYAGMGTGNAWALTTGVAANFQLSATNNPTSWSSTQLPPGLAIDNTGTVIGTVNQPGAYQLTVTAANAAGTSAAQSFSVIVTAASGTTSTAVATLPWLPLDLVDLQFDLRLRAVTSSLLGAVKGFTVGEDLALAVVPQIGGNYIFSGITDLEITIRTTGDFVDCPLIADDPSVTLTPVPFPVSVLTSSTSSASVTVASVPPYLVVGATLLGQLVTAISGTTLTLAANANATIASATAKTFTAPGQQYYLLSFNLDSPEIDNEFGAAITALQITAVAQLKCIYNDMVIISETFPFPVLQRLGKPAGQ